MMYKNWLVQKTNSEFVSYLSDASSVSPAMAQILINRGLNTPEDVAAFIEFAPDKSMDPFSLPGIEEAVEVIQRVMENNTRVFVHGDYDTDGITATSIMVEALRALGVDTVYFIPNRFDHGYGFNPPSVEMARQMGAGLIITVDCGVSSFESTELASKEGIGVLITDHHEPMMQADGVTPRLPNALAIVNPKLNGGEPLSGAGVAFKLTQALALRNDNIFDPMDFTDLAALGTLADSVPLQGENRHIVKLGLPKIEEGRRVGIRALKEVSGIGTRKLKATRLAFTLVPRMNAAGRLADATEVVDLMLSTSEAEAMDIAASLDQKNYERQRIEEKVFRAAMAQVEQMEPVPSIIVLADDQWHEGVVGIVASKIAERFGRPTFILSDKGEVVKGSGRSVPGFDIHESLVECGELLVAFGGHKQAAGVTLKSENLDAFRSMIIEVVDRTRTHKEQTLNIDATVTFRDINFRFVEELEALEPFGFGNPEPVLGAKDLEVVGPRIVGRNHLKLRLKSNSSFIDAIWFGGGDHLPMIEDTIAVDAAFIAGINEWDDKRVLQLQIRSIRPAD
jgi:single-stranded-DNA-specific exonuclease